MGDCVLAPEGAEPLSVREEELDVPGVKREDKASHDRLDQDQVSRCRKSGGEPIGAAAIEA